MKKLKASSLFYALLISVLIATLSSGLISMAVFNRHILTMDNLEHRLINNTHSALNLLLEDSNYYDEPIVIDLFEEQKDSVLIRKIKWGLLEVIAVEAFHSTSFSKKYKRRTALIGSRPEDWENAALYLADNNKSLILAGQTQINGTAFRPKSGIKSGIVNGQSFGSTVLVNGEQKNSAATLPKTDIKRWKEFYNETNQLVEVNALRDTTHDFFQRTLVVKDSLFLIQNEIKGNCIFIADSLIYVDQNSTLEDIILIAPYIVFGEGVTGSCQAFAQKELIVSSNCHLKYPSILGLFPKEKSIYKNEIEIGEHSTIEGLILAETANDLKHQSKVILKKNSLCKGQVYANGVIDIKGEVWGNLACNSFYLRAGTSSYVNHLWNVKLDANARPNKYLNPFFLNKKKHKSDILKWSN